MNANTYMVVLYMRLHLIWGSLHSLIGLVQERKVNKAIMHVLPKTNRNLNLQKDTLYNVTLKRTNLSRTHQ